MQYHRPTFVGLLTPMPSELRPVVKAFDLRKIVLEGAEMHAGTVGSVAVVAMKTGMGTERAGRATEQLLDSTAVDHVMVIGIAGGMGPSAVGDVLFPAVVVDKDSGREYAPHALPGVQLAGKIVTHDDFDMGPDEHARLVADGFIAVDMETAAIASVCEARECDWSAVRVISDLVGVTPGRRDRSGRRRRQPQARCGPALHAAAPEQTFPSSCDSDATRPRPRPRPPEPPRKPSGAPSSVALLAVDGILEVRRRGLDPGDGLADRVGPARDHVGDRVPERLDRLLERVDFVAELIAGRVDDRLHVRCHVGDRSLERGDPVRPRRRRPSMR